jgi:hypothetical protein
MIRASPNSFTAGLFRNDPLPSQRIQLKPSNLPTLIGQELATDNERGSMNDWEKTYLYVPKRSTFIESRAIISCN